MKEDTDRAEEKLLCGHPACSCQTKSSEKFCCQACAQSKDFAECSCGHIGCEQAVAQIDTANA